MDTERLASFVSASADIPAAADLSVALQQAQAGPSSPRPQSATSTATERPTLHLTDASAYPRKPPSIDSNFSSVQGKTAGTPPDHDLDAEDDETVSSTWDESVTDKASALRDSSAPAAPAEPQTASPKIGPAASSDRPDWMTDDLDESWPEDDQAGPSTPTPSNPAPIDKAPEAGPETSQAERPRSPVRSAPAQHQLATPSLASRPPLSAGIRDALPDPAFSAARHQARRALLKGRASAAGAPTPRTMPPTGALQAGPTTPSLRIPSHQSRRERLRSSNAENEEGDSTIWSESESEPESDSASNDSAPDDFASARGSLAENSRITNMQTAQQSRTEPQQQPLRSPSAASDASGAKGTFIHKADASSLPPILRPVWQSPAKGQNGQNRKGMTALGGDMFTPMKLQTMFKTPTPPEKPAHSIMSALAAAATPFNVPDVPTTSATATAQNVPEDPVQLRSVQDTNQAESAKATPAIEARPQALLCQAHPLPSRAHMHRHRLLFTSLAAWCHRNRFTICKVCIPTAPMLQRWLDLLPLLQTLVFIPPPLQAAPPISCLVRRLPTPRCVFSDSTTTTLSLEPNWNRWSTKRRQRQPSSHHD